MTHILPAFDSSILISTGYNAAICESVNLKAFVYYKLHCVNWPSLRQKQMYKTSRISEEMDRKISVIDHYAKEGGAGVVSPSCSFYHDPFAVLTFCLARYKANIHKLGSDSFSEPVHLIDSKPYVLK